MQIHKDKNMPEIKARVRKYLYDKGIRLSDFFKETGVAESAFRGKAALSEFGGSAIASILRAYPEISALWLITGEEPTTRASSISIEGHFSNATMGNGSRVSIETPIRTSDERSSEVSRLYDTLLQEKDQQIALQAKTISLLEGQLQEKDALLRMVIGGRNA